ncbi:FAD-dependent monooxygenase [Streptomyces sp. NPDC091267]|uniref:FAD-dependent monooxygenase n=1 Tax=Streptomyces sp. NPDC091267 TaxID=3155195 RepID=UPI00343ECA05
MGGLHAQVLVVGGGPVGMLLAAELAAGGVDAVVVEPGLAASRRPKATTLHARAVQCLARRGYVFPPASGASPVRGSMPAGPGAGTVPGRGAGSSEGAASVSGSGAVEGRTMPFHFAGIGGLSISAPDGEPVPILKTPQIELERLFEGRARSAGVRVLRGYRMTELAQDGTGVRVSVAGPRGGREVWCVGYVVGADGARSTVREVSGIGSDVGAPTVSATMGAVRVAEGAEVEVGWHRTPRGWLVAKRGSQGRTVLQTLVWGDSSADRRLPLTVDEFSQEVSRVAGRDIALSGGRWLSRFSDFTRLARTYRAGRVFLAGDAAHVHFPVGGQGLTTGVLDALNLGWKLALVVRGAADDDLLDTYGAERRPAAERVIHNTRAQVALMRPGAEADSLRALVAELVESDGGNDFLAGMISAQDTVLPAGVRGRSSWEGRFLDSVDLVTGEGPSDVIGVLGKGVEPVLLLLGDGTEHYAQTAQAWARSLRVVRCRPVRAVGCAALLVRPDGYVSWASDGGAPLAEALPALFGAGGADDDAKVDAGNDGGVDAGAGAEAGSDPGEDTDGSAGVHADPDAGRGSVVGGAASASGLLPLETVV